MVNIIKPRRGDSDPGPDDLADGEIAIRKDTTPPKLFVKVGSNVREIGGGSGDANQTLTTGNGISGANSGSDGNFTMAVEPAQTTITSIFATDLKIGEDDQTKIDFETQNQIHFYLNNAKDFSMTANTFTAESGSSIVVPAGGLTIGSTAVSSTAAELNILDGVTASTSELNIMDGVTATTSELNIMDGVTATTSELNVLDGFAGVTADLTYAKDLRATGVTTTEFDKLDGLTASTSELNILDGVTATASELNIMDGVTSTTAELNKLDGFTGDKDDLIYAKDLKATGVTTTEFDKLDGLTASTSELNIMDGVTSTTAELNILDGVTATASELNILDGVTATTSELNIMDGVTSTTAELNKLDGFTGDKDDLIYAKDLKATGVTTTEFDKLDGLTASTSELNIMDGVTATTAELNIMDGVTATASELNVLDGISSVDTNLNSVSGSDDTLASAKAIKSYVDANAGGGGDTGNYSFSSNTFSNSNDVTFDFGGDMVIDVDSGQLEIKDADNSHFKFDCDNNAFSIMDDADSGDLFGIIVDANGETFVQTIDDDGANAHLTFDADGDIILDAESGIHHIRDSGNSGNELKIAVSSSSGATTIETLSSSAAGGLTVKADGDLQISATSASEKSVLTTNAGILAPTTQFIYVVTAGMSKIGTSSRERHLSFNTTSGNSVEDNGNLLNHYHLMPFAARLVSIRGAFSASVAGSSSTFFRLRKAADNSTSLSDVYKWNNTNVAGIHAPDAMTAESLGGQGDSFEFLDACRGSATVETGTSGAQDFNEGDKLFGGFSVPSSIGTNIRGCFTFVFVAKEGYPTV